MNGRKKEEVKTGGKKIGYQKSSSNFFKTFVSSIVIIINRNGGKNERTRRKKGGWGGLLHATRSIIPRQSHLSRLKEQEKGKCNSSVCSFFLASPRYRCARFPEVCLCGTDQPGNSSPQHSPPSTVRCLLPYAYTPRFLLATR